MKILKIYRNPALEEEDLAGAAAEAGDAGAEAGADEAGAEAGAEAPAAEEGRRGEAAPARARARAETPRAPAEGRGRARTAAAPEEEEGANLPPPADQADGAGEIESTPEVEPGVDARADAGRRGEVAIVPDDGSDEEGQAGPGGEDDELASDAFESDAMAVDGELSDRADEQENVEVALESLQLQVGNIQHLIKTGACSRETLNLVTFSAQQELNRLGMKLKGVSLESDDIVGQHQLVMEGLQSFIDAIVQAYYLRYTHQYNAIADFFKSAEGQLKKYENELDRVGDTVKQRADTLKDEAHESSFVHLWYFFRNDKGMPANVPEAMKKDLEMSSFVLSAYPKTLLGLFKKLISVVGSGSIANEAAAKKFAKAVSSLQHPAELFNKNLLGGQPYFNVTGLDMKQGSRRNPITLGGESFDKLAALASVKQVSESGSLMHKAKKAIQGGGPIGMLTNHNYQTSDITHVVEMGKTYAANVREYHKVAEQFKQAGQEFAQAFKKLVGTAGSEADTAVAQVVKQVEQYAGNIQRCFETPGIKEASRSIRATKYTSYMALAMWRSAH